MAILGGVAVQKNLYQIKNFLRESNKKIVRLTYNMILEKGVCKSKNITLLLLNIQKSLPKYVDLQNDEKRRMLCQNLSK
jgi:hypothetical protein